MGMSLTLRLLFFLTSSNSQNPLALKVVACPSLGELKSSKSLVERTLSLTKTNSQVLSFHATMFLNADTELLNRAMSPTNSVPKWN